MFSKPSLCCIEHRLIAISSCVAQQYRAELATELKNTSLKKKNYHSGKNFKASFRMSNNAALMLVWALLVLLEGLQRYFAVANLASYRGS